MTAIETPDQARRRLGLQRSRGREMDSAHLSRIKQLPCLVCSAYPPTEAAHIRLTEFAYGQHMAGMALKPSDCMTIPLCAKCHRQSTAAEHNVGTRAFWRRLKIKPHEIAYALWLISSDHNHRPTDRLTNMEAYLVRLRFLEGVLDHSANYKSAREGR